MTITVEFFSGDWLPSETQPAHPTTPNMEALEPPPEWWRSQKTEKKR